MENIHCCCCDKVFTARNYDTLRLSVDKYSKILKGIYSTRLFCLECSIEHSYLIFRKSEIQVENADEVPEMIESAIYNEEMDIRWMEADMKEYNKNKELYDKMNEDKN